MYKQIVVIIVVAVLVVISFCSGFIFGNTSALHSVSTEVSPTVQDDAVVTTETENMDFPAKEEPSTTESEVAFVIKTDSLNDTQRNMLSILGIESDEIEVTYAMLACAESKIESARLVEIQNGASPSFSEGMKLIGCLD